MAYRSIDQRLHDASVALQNLDADPVLADALAAYGYDAERLREGASRLDAARSAQRAYVQAYGAQHHAVDVFRAAFDAARTTYMRHLKVARIALRGQSAAREALKLGGDRANAFAAWMEQARALYTNAPTMPAVMTALARFNVTSDDLSDAADTLEALMERHVAKEAAKGAAQASTARRDAALDALGTWMRDFRAIARIALDDRPQHLEKIGIVVPS